MKIARFTSLVLLALASSGACKAEDTASTASSKPAPTPKLGIDSIEEASAVIQEALKLGESTWPGATVGGVKVGDEVPKGVRSEAYSVRVSFEFDADLTDPAAKSGSVVCSPECVVIRHKIKRAGAAPFPCAFDEALAAARKAGVSPRRPLVAYGYWNLDGRSGWTFRSDDAAPVVEIGDGCAVKP
jgi:hypothetical protein